MTGKKVVHGGGGEAKIEIAGPRNGRAKPASLKKHKTYARSEQVEEGPPRRDEERVTIEKVSGPRNAGTFVTKNESKKNEDEPAKK